MTILINNFWLFPVCIGLINTEALFVKNAVTNPFYGSVDNIVFFCYKLFSSYIKYHFYSSNLKSRDRYG